MQQATLAVITMRRCGRATSAAPSFFENAPRALEEAAWIDGAGYWRGLFSVVLPTATPGLAATAILCFVFSWNDFFFALILTRSSAMTAPVAVVNFMNYAGPADFVPGIEASMRDAKGHTYAYGVEAGAMILNVARADLIDKAGLALPTTTMDELIKVCDAIHDKDGVAAWTADKLHHWNWVPYLQGMGGRIFKDPPKNSPVTSARRTTELAHGAVDQVAGVLRQNLAGEDSDRLAMAGVSAAGIGVDDFAAGEHPG